MRRKNFSSIQVDAELKSRIEYLTKTSGCKSQNDFLNKALNPIFDVACNFKYSTFESYPLLTKSCVYFQFYPKVAMVHFGENKPVGAEYND
jgi:hypothetical protein